MEKGNCWNSRRKEKDAEDLLPTGWNQQAGDEDLIHSAGSGESSKTEAGPKNTGVARTGPTVLGHGESRIPEGWTEQNTVP